MVAAVARALPGAGAARKWAVEVMADAAGPYLIACGVGWDEEPGALRQPRGRLGSWRTSGAALCCQDATVSEKNSKNLSHVRLPTAQKTC